jgi:RNA polymerase sigma-70 factor (ECF subfamily)
LWIGHHARMRREDFERLYDEHAGALYSFLAYRSGDPTLAEDLLADTFERALRSRRGFDPRKGKEKTWLYSIALNLLRDRVRRGRAAERALERSTAGVRGADAGDALDGIERRDELGRALATLSPEEREAVALRYGADLTVPEVADVLGEPLQRVEGRVYRALRKLREELG